jgi:hypothetical protein
VSRLLGTAGLTSCARYRPALADLAELRLAGAESSAAIEHVERCPGCARELGELMLTVVVLRRMGAEAAIAKDSAPDDAWGRLRARIERSSRRARARAWQWRATVGGLATASLLVAVLVGPAAIRVTDTTYREVQPAAFYQQIDRAETQQEEVRLNTLRRNAASSPTQWVGAVMRPASASRWHPLEDEGGAADSTPTEAPRSQSAGIRPI